MIVKNLSTYENIIQSGEFLSQMWNSCLLELKQQLHEQTFLTWIQPIKAVHMSNNELCLEVPSQFFYDWIDSHYSELINKTVANTVGKELNIKFDINQSQESISDIIDIVKTESIKETHNIYQVPFTMESNLHPRFKFDNFIQGDGNKFARAAAHAVAKNLGETDYNPLLIFGCTGLGKTHLMQAIGNYVQSNYPKKRVCYTTSEQFTSDFINAIQQNKRSQFSAMYRNIDVLLLDDIQFFSGKGKTQEEFFHTFNALYLAGKQIVLSSDRAPSDIQDVEDRLLSRFQCGLVVDVQPPDYETRIAILNQRAFENGVQLPIEIIEYLAANITSSIRELEGAITRIMAQASLTQSDITLDFVKSIIQKIVKVQKQALTIEKIIKIVSDYFNIQENLLLAKTRKKEIVNARQVAIFFVKEFTNHSVKSIGLHFGGRDHTTVLYSINTVENLLAYDQQMIQHIRNIRQKLEQLDRLN